MKTIKIFCTIIVLPLLQHAFAQTANGNKAFTIKGTLTGTHVDSVTLYYEGDGGQYMHETNPVLNNEFTLTGNIPHPVSARVMFKKTGEVIPRNLQEGRMREFYIEPTAMTIAGDAVDVKTLSLTGSKTDIEYQELNGKVAPIREEMKPIEVAFMNEKDHEKAAAIHDQFEPYNDRIKKVTYQFFTVHPNSYVTLDMMKYFVSRMSLDSIKRVYNAFNDQLKATTDAQELVKRMEKIEAGLPGAIAPLFTKTDINGKPLSLADFKGKYVMLDFWASWCVPCRKSNPHMIELYNKYKSKGFDVIGIADDDVKVAAWNAAVAQDKVGIWHNVLRGLKIDMIRNHIPNPDDLDQQYGIASIPTKILIGPDGKILGRYGDTYGGTEEDMDKLLVEIFKF